MRSDKPILVTSPLLPDLQEFNSYLEQIWDSRWLTNNGSIHQQLEHALAEYLGVEYISLFTNGTLPLITALQALDLTKGEVITTPYSFVATTHSIWWNGLKPVFVDVEPTTGNLDPTKIEAAITENTVAIMPVHVYGQPCDNDQIDAIAKRHNLKVCQGEQAPCQHELQCPRQLCVRQADSCVLIYGGQALRVRHFSL